MKRDANIILCAVSGVFVSVNGNVIHNQWLLQSYGKK